MSRYRTVGAFVLLAALWGVSFTVTKVGLAELPPALFAALRFDLAAVVLFGYGLLAGIPLRPQTREDWWYVIVGGIFTLGGHNALLFAGQQYVTSAVAAVLLGLIPVVTPAVARAFAPGERLSPLGIVGVLVGFLGVVIIGDVDPTAVATSDLRGVGLVVASAVVFALGAVLNTDRDVSLSLFATQPWMMAIGAVLLHVTSIALPTESLADARFTPTSVFAIVFMALVAGAAGFWLYFYLLARVGPIETSFVEYVTPLFAALAGWVVLREALSVSTVVGFGCILVGFVLVKRRAVGVELARLRAATVGAVRDRPRD